MTSLHWNDWMSQGKKGSWSIYVIENEDGRFNFCWSKALQCEFKAGCAPQQLDSMVLAECFGPACSDMATWTFWEVSLDVWMQKFPALVAITRSLLKGKVCSRQICKLLQKMLQILWFFSVFNHKNERNVAYWIIHRCALSGLVPLMAQKPVDITGFLCWNLGYWMLIW